MAKHIDEILSIARKSRISAIKMTNAAKAAHVGSSLSMIDIIATIYNSLAEIGPSIDPVIEDIVLISKGHAAAGTYAVLAHSGLLDIEKLDQYCMDGADLGGHVTAGVSPWVRFSTGSLGHALPFGVGVALAAKRDGIHRRVFVVLSDGELNEGSNWEAALQASHLGLDNLFVYIDRNYLQSLRSTEETIRLEPLLDKWSAFGWNSSNIDGHSVESLLDSFEKAKLSNRPNVFICETKKGFGVSFMENQVSWHYKSPSNEELVAAISEIEGR